MKADLTYRVWSAGTPLNCAETSDKLWKCPIKFQVRQKFFRNNFYRYFRMCFSFIELLTCFNIFYLPGGRIYDTSKWRGTLVSCKGSIWVRIKIAFSLVFFRYFCKCINGTNSKSGKQWYFFRRTGYIPVNYVRPKGGLGTEV